MTFKPKIWYPIALVLAVINLAGMAFAFGQSEPTHAGVHIVLTLVCLSWARRLRQGRRLARDEVQQDELSDNEARIDELGADVSDLRRELTEAQERLDFAERMLAQGAEKRRADERSKEPKPPPLDLPTPPKPKPPEPWEPARIPRPPKPPKPPEPVG
jgi:outer membrane biosynthesis protein TonB